MFISRYFTAHTVYPVTLTPLFNQNWKLRVPFRHDAVQNNFCCKNELKIFTLYFCPPKSTFQEIPCAIAVLAQSCHHRLARVVQALEPEQEQQLMLVLVRVYRHQQRHPPQSLEELKRAVEKKIKHLIVYSYWPIFPANRCACCWQHRHRKKNTSKVFCSILNSNFANKTQVNSITHSFDTNAKKLDISWRILCVYPDFSSTQIQVSGNFVRSWGFGADIVPAPVPAALPACINGGAGGGWPALPGTAAAAGIGMPRKGNTRKWRVMY